MNHTEYLSIIRSHLPALRGVDARIGKYILDYPEKVINMTVAKLARTVQVSEGSIILFCQKLGFEGYTALKIGIAANLQTKNRFVLGDIEIGAASEPYAVMTEMFQAIFCVLQETMGMLDRDALARAADAIDGAHRVEFYGVGTSAPIAEDAYYRFMRIGVPAAVCVDPHIMMVSANQLKPGDVALAVSHTGRSRQTVDALRKAKEQGATTLCITSYAGSPVTQTADISLITSLNTSDQIREATVARIAHIAILDSLCTYIAMKHNSRTEKSMDQMLRLLKEQRYE